MEGNNTENKQDVNLVSEQLCHCHQKATPRRKEELKILKNRLNRIVGQLNGIGKMQTAAAESALQSFAYLILQEHMETCVVEEIGKGNLKVIEETVELVKKLK